MCGDGCVYIDEETIIHCYRQIQIASPLTDRFFVGLEKQHMSKSFISIPNSKHRQQCLFNIWALFSWNKLNVIHVSEHSFFGLQGRWQWGCAVQIWLTFKTRKVWISIRLTFNLRPLLSTFHLSSFRTLSRFLNIPSFLSPSLSCSLLCFFASDGPGGTYCMLSGRLLVHPGRKWRVGGGGQEMEWELILFSHTLALKSCTLGTTVKWSLTLHSLSTQEPSLTDTSREELNLLLEYKHSLA